MPWPIAPGAPVMMLIVSLTLNIIVIGSFPLLPHWLAASALVGRRFSENVSIAENTIPVDDPERHRGRARSPKRRRLQSYVLNTFFKFRKCEFQISAFF
jgi:hypothetical protein